VCDDSVVVLIGNGLGQEGEEEGRKIELVRKEMVERMTCK